MQDEYEDEEEDMESNEEEEDGALDNSSILLASPTISTAPRPLPSPTKDVAKSTIVRYPMS